MLRKGLMMDGTVTLFCQSVVSSVHALRLRKIKKLYFLLAFS